MVFFKACPPSLTGYQRSCYWTWWCFLSFCLKEIHFLCFWISFAIGVTTGICFERHSIIHWCHYWSTDLGSDQICPSIALDIGHCTFNKVRLKWPKCRRWPVISSELLQVGVIGTLLPISISFGERPQLGWARNIHTNCRLAGVKLSILLLSMTMRTQYEWGGKYDDDDIDDDNSDDLYIMLM